MAEPVQTTAASFLATLEARSGNEGPVTSGTSGKVAGRHSLETRTKFWNANDPPAEEIRNC